MSVDTRDYYTMLRSQPSNLQPPTKHFKCEKNYQDIHSCINDNLEPNFPGIFDNVCIRGYPFWKGYGIDPTIATHVINYRAPNTRCYLWEGQLTTGEAHVLFSRGRTIKRQPRGACMTTQDWFKVRCRDEHPTCLSPKSVYPSCQDAILDHVRNHHRIDTFDNVWVLGETFIHGDPFWGKCGVDKNSGGLHYMFYRDYDSLCYRIPGKSLSPTGMPSLLQGEGRIKQAEDWECFEGLYTVRVACMDGTIDCELPDIVAYPSCKDAIVNNLIHYNLQTLDKVNVFDENVMDASEPIPFWDQCGIEGSVAPHTFYYRYSQSQCFKIDGEFTSHSAIKMATGSLIDGVVLQPCSDLIGSFKVECFLGKDCVLPPEAKVMSNSFRQVV